MLQSLLKLPMSYETVCSDDGRMFACVGQRVNVFEVGTGQRILSARPLAHPSHADFSPNNKKLVIKFTNGRIVVLNLARGEILRDYENQKEGEGCEIFFSPEGQELADGSWNGLISVRKVRGSGTIVEQRPDEMVDRISHDSRRHIWVIQRGRKLMPGQNWRDYGYLSLYRWPFFERKPKLFLFEHYIESATISPEGSRICFIGRQRSGERWIQVVRTSDGKAIARTAAIKVGGTGSELSWSPDSRLIGSVQKGKFVLFRASDLAIVAEVGCQYPSSICFLPRRAQVVLSTWNSSALVTIADVLTGGVKMR